MTPMQRRFYGQLICVVSSNNTLISNVVYTLGFTHIKLQHLISSHLIRAHNMLSPHFWISISRGTEHCTEEESIRLVLAAPGSWKNFVHQETSNNFVKNCLWKEIQPVGVSVFYFAFCEVRTEGTRHQTAHTTAHTAKYETSSSVLSPQSTVHFS